MPSRRTFLRTAAVAGGALAASRAEAQSEKPATAASIAELSSMRELAKPITADERRSRIERARRLMAQNKLDAVMMIGGTSLVYFTGIRWWNSERLFALVLTAKGQPFCVSPAFEEERAREQLEAGPLGKSAQVLTWEEEENPYALLARGLRDRGLASARLGVEEKTFFVFADEVAKAAPSLRVVSGTPVTAGCRRVKDGHEIALMRLASEVTLKAYEAAWRAVQPGMTDKQVGELISAAHTKLGFSGGAMVLVDEFSALPHGTVKPQTVRENSLVLIDGGCSVEGYASDITRTFVVGKAGEKQKRVFDLVRRAQTAALKAARPGVPCEAVDAAARQIITAEGYGPGYKYFTHRLGHGMGMDGHEWPYLVRGNKLALAPGMTFSDEPGIYIRGEFGVRLEDDMLITATGAELFTPQSLSLEQPFGK